MNKFLVTSLLALSLLTGCHSQNHNQRRVLTQGDKQYYFNADNIYYYDNGVDITDVNGKELYFSGTFRIEDVN